MAEDADAAILDVLAFQATERGGETTGTKAAHHGPDNEAEQFSNVVSVEKSATTSLPSPPDLPEADSATGPEGLPEGPEVPAPHAPEGAAVPSGSEEATMQEKEACSPDAADLQRQLSPGGRQPLRPELNAV